MPEKDAVQSRTNSTQGSCKELQCDCDTMWSLVQQKCTMRMCRLKGSRTGSILQQFNVRARRISATYARFYLELEDGGKDEFKGRFYWMALGAFASKTVACSLELLRVQMLPSVFNGLGKGNFWLFQDIAGWHWYYTLYRNSVEPCFERRDASSYLRPVQAQVANYPWKDKALPKIKDMKISAHIKLAFQKAREFESEANVSKQASIQMANLMAVADHEQREILQPLIYDEKCFSGWVAAQRSIWVSWASPKLSLVFSSACDTRDAHLESLAADDTVLEDVESRMIWIKRAADSFHSLMQKKPDYMEAELRAMAGWVTMEDSEPPVLKPPQIYRL
ncbi:DUF2515 family protein [Herbaspirillum seropedicae]|uniref:DUF2515 family protein n=1 Tax=Herbaspirillum seropedicae TaxID=964 RepID=UPI003D985EA4